MNSLITKIKYGAVAIGLFCVSETNAQENELVKATEFIQTQNYSDAKSYVDQAHDIIQNNKSNNIEVKNIHERKMWYYRGSVYLHVGMDTENIKEKLGYFQEAITSIDAYFENDETKFYMNEVKSDLELLANQYKNLGVELYNQQRFKDALAMFEMCISQKKRLGVDMKDMQAYFNAAYSAQYANNVEKTQEYFQLLIDQKYNGASSVPGYYAEIAEAQSKAGLDEKALETIYSAKEQYPDNAKLISKEIDIYLKLGKTESAIAAYEKIIALQPENANHHENLGKLYEKLNKYEKALAAYKKAIEIDAKRPDTYYGIGRLYLIKSNELSRKLGQLTTSESDQAVAEEIKTEQVGVKNQAILYFETALEYAPNDLHSLDALMKTYKSLGDEAKASEMEKRIQALNN